MEECFDIVNEYDEVIKAGLKKGEYSPSKDITRIVSVYLSDNSGAFYLAKRSMNKEPAPGEIFPTANGKVNSGESYIDAGIRETEEELGIKNAKLEKINHFYIEFENNAGLRKFFKTSYALRMEKVGKLNFDEGEIEKIIKYDSFDDFEIHYKENKNLYTKAMEVEFSMLKDFLGKRRIDFVDKKSLSYNQI